MAWLQSTPLTYLHISVLTLGEIRKGAEKLPNSHKRHTIVKWLKIDLLREFFGRIVNINEEIADKWGYISS